MNKSSKASDYHRYNDRIKEEAFDEIGEDREDLEEDESNNAPVMSDNERSNKMKESLIYSADSKGTHETSINFGLTKSL